MRYPAFFDDVEKITSPGKVVQPGDLMQSALGPDATEEERKNFPEKWQQMVAEIFANVDQVIRVRAS